MKVQQILDLACSTPGRLSTWEEEFLTNLVQDRSELSEKQAQPLPRIQDKMAAPTEVSVALKDKRLAPSGV